MFREMATEMDKLLENFKMVLPKSNNSFYSCNYKHFQQKITTHKLLWQ